MKAVLLATLMGLGMASTVAMADDDHAERQAQQAAKVSYDAAKNYAVRAVGGGSATDIDFELKRGRSYYEVEVMHGQDDYEVKIDANTGAVISKKLDN